MRCSCLLTALLTFGLVGCGMSLPTGTASTSSTKGGIAVIDLDVIAKSVGRDHDIEEAVKARLNGMRQEIGRVAQSYQEQLEAKRKEYGDTPTDEQQNEIRRMQVLAQNNLAKLDREATLKLEQFKVEMIARFRTDVRPIAQEVASARGLSVVIPKNENLLLSVDPGVDITADVLKAVQSRSNKTAAAPAPPVNPIPTTEAKPAPAKAPAPKPIPQTANTPEAKTAR